MSFRTTILYRFFRCVGAAILAMAILSGCSSTSETTADHSLSASDIIASVNAQADSIRTFSAYGSINIETPTLNQGAGFDLAVKRPDSTRITVEGPFGITLAKALFTNERFVAYNALNNTIYQGNRAQGLNSFPMMSAFPSGILMDALSGVRHFKSTTAVMDTFFISENKFYISFIDTASVLKFSVDPNSMRVSSVTSSKLSGELQWKEFYTYRQLDNGKWIPSSARIEIPKKTIALDISFDEVTINEPMESMMISLPDDAERTDIQ